MAKKQKGKKKGKKSITKPDDGFSEVEREFLLIQISDLTRKYERLKARCLELEASNEEYEKNYKKLDEDRADIIAYLKRQVKSKTDEISELQERVNGLIKSSEATVEAYTQKIAQMEHEFKVMREQLSAEIRLLSGKLNSLEEFRLQREELMRKFKKQEADIEEQEARHKQTLYDIEKKFIIGKDNLKKEMETRLLQLSTDFQNATQLRIAATTHRTIRENIAISNELQIMQSMVKELSDENDVLRNKNEELKLETQLHEEEKKIVLKKCQVQVKLIERLSREHRKLVVRVGMLEFAEKQTDQLKAMVEDLTKQRDDAQTESNIFRQHIDACIYELKDLRRQTAEAIEWALKLQEAIDNATTKIKEALFEPVEDEAESMARREELLERLLELLSIRDIKFTPLRSIPSLGTSLIYTSGNLGLVPQLTEEYSESAIAPASKEICETGPEKKGKPQHMLDYETDSASSHVPSVVEDIVKELAEATFAAIAEKTEADVENVLTDIIEKTEEDEGEDEGEEEEEREMESFIE